MSPAEGKPSCSKHTERGSALPSATCELLGGYAWGGAMPEFLLGSSGRGIFVTSKKIDVT